MPINCFTGLMGSGKSFECVASVVVPAVRAGRRVVTNIDGINGDLIRDYCVQKFDCDLDKLGTVVHVSNVQCEAENFFPVGDGSESIVNAGDLVCVDEAWRFWGTGSKFPKSHHIFFREHRHFVDPVTNVCCDLVFMVQDIADLHRSVKVLVELSFRTTKLKSVGMHKTYRLEMWEGYQLVHKRRVRTEVKKYDPEIFPLYSSYVGGVGKELTVDDRQNIFKNTTLQLLIVGFVLLGGLSFYYIKTWLAQGQKKVEEVKLKPPSVPEKVLSSDRPSVVKDSEVWKIAGVVTIKDQTFVVLSNGASKLRYEHPANFKYSGLAMFGFIDGERVSRYSGVSSKSNQEVIK